MLLSFLPEDFTLILPLKPTFPPFDSLPWSKGPQRLAGSGSEEENILLPLTFNVSIGLNSEDKDIL